MAFRSLARAVGVVCILAWAGPAHALLLSDVYAYQTSGGAAPTLTVGDITFYFTSCGGLDCTSISTTPYGTPFNRNFEIVGVPASSATGPGGGIMLRSIGTDPLLAVGQPQGGDVSLHWAAMTANPVVGAQGSAVGSGVNAGGGGATSLHDAGASYLGSVSMNPNDPSPDIIAFAPQTVITGSADYAIAAGSLQSSTVFLSQVPEPLSLSLLLSGLVGLGWARRRRPA